MNDEMRAEFEVAFRAQFGFGASDVHDSKSEDGAALMGAALWAWEASRAAVRVMLPATGTLLTPGWNQAVHRCREAIEAAGLKVAP